MTKARLVFEDGTLFEGIAFASVGERFGEVVFNTAMSGYQEVLTDPSYYRQMVVMTYPLMGNYGINAEDVESSGLFLSALILSNISVISVCIVVLLLVFPYDINIPHKKGRVKKNISICFRLQDLP